MTLSTEICKDLKRANVVKNVVIAALVVINAALVVNKCRSKSVAKAESGGRGI